MDAAQQYLGRMDTVMGYFSSLDAEVFTALSEEQTRLAVSGDLLEIGVWYGRSAILLGYLAGDGEQVYFNDLFETPLQTEAGLREAARGCPATRADFERNYGRFHAKSPNVLQCPSSELGSNLERDRFRFIHIDGSHMYEAVQGDLELARGLLGDGGIVVFDDYANTQFIGVAAAVWPALATLAFSPFAATPSKLFASLPEYAPHYRSALAASAAGRKWNQLVTPLPPHSEVLSVWENPKSRSFSSRIARKATRTLQTVSRARRTTSPASPRSGSQKQ